MNPEFQINEKNYTIKMSDFKDILNDKEDDCVFPFIYRGKTITQMSDLFTFDDDYE